jgi:hypothetical protein
MAGGDARGAMGLGLRFSGREFERVAFEELDSRLGGRGKTKFR